MAGRFDMTNSSALTIQQMARMLVSQHGRAGDKMAGQDGVPTPKDGATYQAARKLSLQEALTAGRGLNAAARKECVPTPHHPHSHPHSTCERCAWHTMAGSREERSKLGRHRTPMGSQAIARWLARSGGGHATRPRVADAMPVRGPRVALAVGLRTLLVLLRPTSLLARTRLGVSLDDITKAHTELMDSVGRALAAEISKDETYEADPWEQPDW